MIRCASMLLTLILLVPSVAKASPEKAATETQKEQTARQLFRTAEKHFYAGRFGDALQSYQQAYSLWPLPGFLFNIGQCHRYLGNYETALRHFRVYLTRLPNAKNRIFVERLIRLTEHDLARSRSAGPTVPDEKQAGPAPSTPSSAPVVKKALRPAPTRPDHSKAWLWAGVGLSAAFITTGVITGVLSVRDSQAFKDPNTAKEDLEALRDRGRALATAGWVSAGLGAAVAVATAIWWWAGRETPVDHTTDLSISAPGTLVFSW